MKALVDAGVPLARVRRELVEIARRCRRALDRGGADRDAGGRVRRARRRPARTARSPAGPDSGERAAPPGEVRELPARRTSRPCRSRRRRSPPTSGSTRARARGRRSSRPLDAYRRSPAAAPRLTEAWINLGRLFAENGDAEAATECFPTALKLDPTDATAIYNMGVVAQDAGREPEAIDLYPRALDLEPSLAEAHYNLATLFDQRGDSQRRSATSTSTAS